MESMSQLHSKANYLAQLYRRDYLRTCKDIERLYELHEIINQAQLKLKREECILMMNEYFLPADQNWWCINYEKEMFDKKKNMALHAFFRCLTA